MTKVISKKEQAVNWLAQNLQVFQCPVCASEFVELTGLGIRCANKHSFDLARNGYLNLLAGKQNTYYRRELFSARRRVFSAGVYEPVIAQTASFIDALGKENSLILDAGCGEGSFLVGLGTHLPQARLMGSDISRPGIQLAAAGPVAALWCVADLAQLPLREGSFDVILNVLSPANYGQFQRVLKPDGVLIKILPGEHYLREIRERTSGADSYSNDEVVATLKENVKVERQVALQYEVPVQPELWPDLVKMTPLTRHHHISGRAPRGLTIDLMIVQGSVFLEGSRGSAENIDYRHK